MEFSRASAFALSAVPIGFLHFVAKEHATSEVGNDLVPAVVDGSIQIVDTVAVGAGEGGGRGFEFFNVIAQKLVGSAASTAVVNSGVAAEELKRVWGGRG